MTKSAVDVKSPGGLKSEASLCDHQLTFTTAHQY